MFDKIIELKEFKAESERIEQAQASGKDVTMVISVPTEPLDPKDKEKGIVTVYLSERQGIEFIPLYEIRFDKNTEEVLAIIKND